MAGGGKRSVVSEEKDDEMESLSGEANDDESNDEEDEEGQDEYEEDGFIVDEIEEEQEQEEDERKTHKKKKKKRSREAEKNYVLDEDDYDLLEDNNISGFQRPNTGSKKFKRLKKASKESEKGIFKSLFDDEEGAPSEDIGLEDERPHSKEEDIGEEDDDMGDFIVDEEEEIGINGTPTRERKHKKKSLKQHSGVSLASLNEAEDIFGDVDELLQFRTQLLSRSDDDSTSGMNLENEYEPSVLVEKYLTVRDGQIRQTDLPERMQVYEEITGPPPVDEKRLSEESVWIHKQLPTIQWIFQRGVNEGNDEGMSIRDKIDQNDIKRFLKLYHVDKFDIPFIASYRKEHCLSLLKDLEVAETKNEGVDKTNAKPKLKWQKLLWAIKELDRKWLQLKKRKTVLKLYYKKRYEEEVGTIYDESRLCLNKQLFDSIMRSLKKADSQREINDVELKFNLHFPPGEFGLEEGQFKKPKKKSIYSMCDKAGLWEIAGKFGPNAEQLGLHITLDSVSMEVPEDLKESPEEVASNYTCALFETPEAVLQGARHMAAAEISCEPRIRQNIRSTFMEKAEISTIPTLKGNAAIDPFHEFAKVKWLRDKPISKFDDAQWLLIQKAEEEKLLEVSIDLPDEILNKLMDEANICYISDGVSKSARLWNEQRKLILNDAFLKLLIPSVKKEVRDLLTIRAKEWLKMEYAKTFWSKVSIAPYRQKVSEDGVEKEIVPKVMACCLGSGNAQTIFVILDSVGNLVDILSAGPIHIQVNNDVDEERKRNDQQRLLKFMADNQPHVVVLGAANLSCKWLKDEIYEIIFKKLEENPREVGQEMDEVKIYYGDESLPRLYEHSSISSDQLPTQSGITKRAVALGRYLQNPLAMVATLCGAKRDIISWKLNPLDHFLTSDEKFDMIEQIMVDVTNQVGVDINVALTHNWYFAPLQFISGLGPRKASFIQKALAKSIVIKTRKELTEHGLNTKKVFINAIGFLRVRSSGKMGYNACFDILDDTRIHPESYSRAEVLAKTVYDYYNDGEGDDDELTIEYCRSHASQLKSFNIDEYARDSGLIDKKETLYGIVMELLHGFQDWRENYKEPTAEEFFDMATGENDYTLAEGRTVQVKVRKVQDNLALCVLDSGLKGVLFKENMTNDGEDFDLLHEGYQLSCKIKEVQKNRAQVVLTCNERHVKNKESQIHDVDPYYHEDPSKLMSEQEKGKVSVKKQVKQRMISHPRFRNMTDAEAIHFLSDKDDGESIIHPSSRGPSHLTLSLKVYDGVYAHKGIAEGGKDFTDVTGWLRIGKILKIGDETFEDLDEVMDRYVDPLVSNLKAMIEYRKFRKGTKEEIDELLRVEKAGNPSRIAYCFGVSHEYPGTFILTYIRSAKPHHEYVSIYPKGFKYWKRTFDKIDLLVAYFQRHINDPRCVPTPTVRSISAMVPMPSPDIKGRTGGGYRHPSGLPKPYDGHGRGSGDTKNNESESITVGWGASGIAGNTSGWGSKTDGTDGNASGWGGKKSGADGNASGWGGKKKSGTDDNAGRWGGKKADENASGGGGGGWGSWGGDNASGWGGKKSGADGNASGWGGKKSGTDDNASRWGGKKADENTAGGGGGGWGSWGGDKGGTRDPGSDDGWKNFPGSKVQNSPGREAFPGGWGSSGCAGTGSWNNGGAGTGGWNSGGGGGSNVHDGGAGRGGWPGRGHRGGRGRGHGRGNWCGRDSKTGGDGGGWRSSGGSWSSAGGGSNTAATWGNSKGDNSSNNGWGLSSSGGDGSKGGGDGSSGGGWGSWSSGNDNCKGSGGWHGTGNGSSWDANSGGDCSSGGCWAVSGKDNSKESDGWGGSGSGSGCGANSGGASGGSWAVYGKDNSKESGGRGGSGSGWGASSGGTSGGGWAASGKDNSKGSGNWGGIGGGADTSGSGWGGNSGRTNGSNWGGGGGSGGGSWAVSGKDNSKGYGGSAKTSGSGWGGNSGGAGGGWEGGGGSDNNSESKKKGTGGWGTW